MVPQFLRRISVAFVVVVIAALGRVESRQGSIAYWSFTDVQILNCNTVGSIQGFQFDPDDRPVVGWHQSGDCAPTNGPRWSRLTDGAWLTHVIEPGLNYLGGGDSDGEHALAVSPEGTPWLMFSAVDASTGDNNVFAWQSNLEVAPQANIYQRKHFLIGPQNCSGVVYRQRFRPGVAEPLALNTLNLCGRGRSRLFLDGVLIADELPFLHAADLALGPDGSPHIIRITDGQPFYSTGADGGARLIDPATGDLLALGRFASEAQIEVDANGLIHLVISGLNEAGDGVGHIGYLTSTDGVTWSPIEYIDTTGFVRRVVLTLDRNGAPAVAYWRSGGELFYVSRATGAWQSSLVTHVGSGEHQYAIALDFDASNTPAIAFYDPSANANGASGAIRIARPVPGGVDLPVDLAASITATPGTAAVGEPINVRAIASNLSNRMATGVTLTVQLPPGTSFISANPAPSAVDGSSIQFALGAVNSQGTRAIDLRMSAGSVRMLTTSADVSGAQADINLSNNHASVVTAAVAAACFPSTEGMRSWWRAESNTVDAIGGIEGTLQGGVTYTEGIRGQAFAFDGVSGRLRMFRFDDNDYFPVNGSMTWQAWIKTSQASGTIASKYEGENQDGSPSLYFWSLSGGRQSIWFRPAWGESVTLTGNAVVADGAFHHVAVVLDRGTQQVRLYVDGMLDGSADASQMGPVQADDSERDLLVIGARPQCCGGGDILFFNGVIDEFAISARALSAAELEVIAAAPLTCSLSADADSDGVSDGVDFCPLTPPGSPVNSQGCPIAACEVPRDGLTSFWPADRYGNDVAGGNEAFLMGGATYGPGVNGDAFVLNGAGAWVNVPHHASLNVGTGDFTVQLWVKFASTAGEQILVEKYIEIWQPNAPGWLITKLSDNRLLFYGNDGVPAFSPPMAIPANTWIHVAGVRRSGVTTLFMNGSAIATGTAGNVDTPSSLKFGHRGGPSSTPGSVDTRGFFLNGSIDEPAFFNRGLSDAEIAELAAGTAPFCARAEVPLDTDHDGIPDEQDADDDGDGQSDADEIACGSDPLDAGSRSLDSDGDGTVNCSDAEVDNDGVEDGADAFPLDATESADADADGIGDHADPDDDNNGVPDDQEAFYGRIQGGGFIVVDGRRYEFALQIRKTMTASEGHIEMQVKQARRADRLTARAPGTVTFNGNVVEWSSSGEWNGAGDHTFTVRVADVLEPAAARDTFSIVVRNPVGAIVGSVSGALSGGNLQRTK